VCRTVLNPGRPLFREARYILAGEPDIHDTALYHAVLAAIAEGNTTRGGVANYLGRKSTDLAHPLGVLCHAGLITHETEAFKTWNVLAAPPGLAALAARVPQPGSRPALRGDLPPVGPLARRAAPTPPVSPAEQSPTPKPARPQKSTLPSSAAVRATATCCSPSARRSGGRQCPPAT
jgi:hypothetical protein